MKPNEIFRIFQELGVITHGHFLSSSGRHKEEYWEKFRVFEHPRVTEQLCREIADRHHESNVAVVIGPTTGGALLAQEVARQLQVRCMIVEPVSIGGLELRRDFILQADTRVLVVDDVLNTGLTVCETLKALQAFHPEIVGIEVMIDRSNGEASKQFSVPYRPLFSMPAAPSYDPTDCPLCNKGLPVVKPGSRKSFTQQ